VYGKSAWSTPRHPRGARTLDRQGRGTNPEADLRAAPWARGERRSRRTQDRRRTAEPRRGHWDKSFGSPQLSLGHRVDWRPQHVSHLRARWQNVSIGRSGDQRQSKGSRLGPGALADLSMSEPALRTLLLLLRPVVITGLDRSSSSGPCSAMKQSAVEPRFLVEWSRRLDSIGVPHTDECGRRSTRWKASAVVSAVRVKRWA
jgi:hypothetical protein